MLVLGIETSCDETSVAVVESGKRIVSNVVASQIEIHRPYYGVVPEIASRVHTEVIWEVFEQALQKASVKKEDLEGIAVTVKPGLVGSLLVGVSFAKSLAYALGIPFVGLDHIKAHLYAPHLEYDIEYPYIGLLVSGGHTILCVVEGYDILTVYGTTIDDACGEAFDKVAKFYNMGFPGGLAIDKLARQGDDRAFQFPIPSLHKGDHRYDVSYSGLKTAVVTQIDQFWNAAYQKTKENIAASFQKTAISMLIDRVMKLVKDTELKTIVAGGGVAANSRLRAELSQREDVKVIFPSMRLCTDNGAMIAGLGYHYLKDGVRSGLDLNAIARVPLFRKTYP